MKDFKICYVSSEVAPFTSTKTLNALGEVSKALPIALKELGQDIRLMTPKYKQINERKYVLREVIRLREVKIELNKETFFANGKTAFLPNSKVHVYFLSIPEFFDRKGVYLDPETGKPYPDNPSRFAHFCKGVLETLKLLYWQPDIVHCSDWPTSLIPVYLKTIYKDDPFFENTHTVLSVHDFTQMGTFPISQAAGLDLPESLIRKGGALNPKGKLNLLNGGLVYADVISPLGESFAQALIEKPGKYKEIAPTLVEREKDIVGVAIGADYHTWNPETDKLIIENYDLKTLSVKQQNKAAFQEQFQLPVQPETPLIGLVCSGREENSPQLATAKELLKKDVQLFCFSGDESVPCAAWLELVEANPGKIVFMPRLDNRTSHMFVSAVDMVVLTGKEAVEESLHLYGLRYGAVPVATNDFRYRDSVVQFDPETGKGNGFISKDAKAPSVLKAVKAALTAYRDPKVWSKIQKNGMKADFSWVSAARKFLKLYEKAGKKK